ncbi:MAG: hypothetical protein NC918_08885 [Candidatus Omnitrophica bacterium]|nr:hypothetical protein [Candidatus Omnitrophota bacterium]
MSKKFLIFFIFTIFAVNIYADKDKKNQLLDIKFLGGISQSDDFTSNKSVGFWGFVDYSVEEEIPGGYFGGISLTYRLSRFFSLFGDIAISKTVLLMGKKGSYLKGGAIWAADPSHRSSTSPTLPNDIYYISKATMGRIGLKLIYPSEILEPYTGIAFGIVPYEIGFGNKDGSRAYSDILYDVSSISSLIFGTDFNINFNKKNFMTLGLFFEIGASVTEVSTEITNWIWTGWTYTAQFPIIPRYRFGLNLGFYF